MARWSRTLKDPTTLFSGPSAPDRPGPAAGRKSHAAQRLPRKDQREPRGISSQVVSPVDKKASTLRRANPAGFQNTVPGPEFAVTALPNAMPRAPMGSRRVRAPSVELGSAVKIPLHRYQGFQVSSDSGQQPPVEPTGRLRPRRTRSGERRRRKLLTGQSPCQEPKIQAFSNVLSSVSSREEP